MKSHVSIKSVRRAYWLFGICAAFVCSLVVRATAQVSDDPAKAALARDEPRHHLLLQNEFVRIIRVIIPPGESTRYHEHNFDYGVLFVNGTKVLVDTVATPQGTPGNTVTKSFNYTTYAGKRFVHRVHNT